MNDFLWLLIVVDGPLLVGLGIAYVLLHRLPPIETGVTGADSEHRFVYLHRNAAQRRGML